jgi:hypothetical protein
MNQFSLSRPSSAVASISDLDGYTVRDYTSIAHADQDEFGFDPPEEKPLYPKRDQTYSPPEDSTDSPLGGWPGFERDEDRRPKGEYEHFSQLDRLITQNLPNASRAVSRYGQVTPPRTNSTGSVSNTNQETQLSPATSSGASKRKSKSPKEVAQPTSTNSGRKKKNKRKTVVDSAESPNAPEDSKRKASLEKNRLAAAKCRVNKKEKTELLQRDSHDKAVHNAYLKNQVMRMKEEVQQLNALLLAHASCEGCKSPEEIQKHLQNLGAEFLPHQMSIGNYPDYSEMPVDGLTSVSQGGMSEDGYFTMAPSDASMLNPPLPEFNRSADFEVHTPMHPE